MKNQADKQPDDSEATTGRLIAILERREIPSSSLAAKQARLLALLEGGSAPVLNNASARLPRSLPPPPSRYQFETQEAFEESMGYWQENVGRIRAMAARAAALKNDS